MRLLHRRRRLQRHHWALNPPILLAPAWRPNSLLSRPFKREYHSRPGFPLCRQRTIFAATLALLRLRAHSSPGPPQAAGLSLALRILPWVACLSALRHRSPQAVTSSCSSTLPRGDSCPRRRASVYSQTRHGCQVCRHAARRSRAPQPLAQQPLRLLSWHRLLVVLRHPPLGNDFVDPQLSHKRSPLRLKFSSYILNGNARELGGHSLLCVDEIVVSIRQISPQPKQARRLSRCERYRGIIGIQSQGNGSIYGQFDV